MADLYHFLDNPEERRADEEGFDAAVKEYADVSQQIEYLADNRAEREEYGLNLGYQFAAMASFAVALLTMFLLFLVNFAAR